MQWAGKAAVIISICAAAFTGGILVGFIENKLSAEAEPAIVAPTAAVTESDAFTLPTIERVSEESTAARTDYYLIRLSGDDMVIYEVFSDGTKSESDRITIESRALRREDAELLREGIKAYTREEAMMMTEDFIS